MPAMGTHQELHLAAHAIRPTQLAVWGLRNCAALEKDPLTLTTNENYFMSSRVVRIGDDSVHPLDRPITVSGEFCRCK